MVAGISCGAAPFCLRAEPPTAWRTGSDFRRQLENPVGFRWESNPLRDALRSLSYHQQIAIWLDRRIDPGRKTDFSVNDMPLGNALEQLAESLQGATCQVGPVVYVGPKPVASKLATLAAIRRDQTRELPEAARAKLQKSIVWRWEELASPRELLEALAREGSLKVVNIDQLPHDLWAAGDYPAVPLTDCLSLLLAGFDMTFDIARDGSAIRLTPLPDEVSLERTYRPRGSLTAMMERLASEFPDALFRSANGSLVVKASFEEHELIARLMRGEPTRPQQVVRGEKRFDLRFDNQPVGEVIKLLAEREQLSVRVHPAVQQRLRQRLSLDVKQASLTELLDRMLQAVRVTYRLEDESLELLPVP